MSRLTRGTPAGNAYLDLQNEARRTRRPTQELLQLYALEGFLARLAASDARERFVLKGGVLLAAFDSRRPTKDVDLAGIDIANDTKTVGPLIHRVLRIKQTESDGIEFAADSTTAEVVREEDDYAGVRVRVNARLATAKLPFHVDVNIGDPIWPEPTTVAVPRLRGGAPIELPGYPMHMVYAEKIVTAVQRGTANTRWRDFGDIWNLSRRQVVDADDLRRAMDEVARHRSATLRPLVEVLDGFDSLAQRRWAPWRRRSNSDHLPEQFARVLRAVIAFADPVLTGAVGARTWDTDATAWRNRSAQ
ncbi:MAG TPA: nucleotidyl transferase AbiEii/AbiGii toxin family protein [Micromonosporaceae bacterium]|nr:nucleotidyl transferase AbiEii/AbiGii toxin family protein [Micromonosporaceae bacterium]